MNIRIISRSFDQLEDHFQEKFLSKRIFLVIIRLSPNVLQSENEIAEESVLLFEINFS